MGKFNRWLDENHIHMSLAHTYNTKPIRKAFASNHDEVKTHLASAKKIANEHKQSFHVTVHDTRTGEVQTHKVHPDG